MQYKCLEVTMNGKQRGNGWKARAIILRDVAGRLEGEEGPRGSGIGSPFIQESVDRLSRNLIRSTGILVARHSLSFILLA